MNKQEFVLALRILHNVFYNEPLQQYIDTIRDNQVLSLWSSVDDLDIIRTACDEINHSIAADGFEKIKRDYYRLFLGPGPVFAYQNGSVYTDRENLLFGDTTMKFKSFCDRYVEMELDCNRPPDHLGLMLAILAELFEAEMEEQVDEILTKHLMPWGPRMLSLVIENANTDYFKGFAILSSRLLNELVSSRNIKVEELELYF
ncbi:TorD/DmsD family molecular chaperone [Shewanella sp. TC10]|uniref:TorD/DmsD family molecular chaperone n=1 Tax=Shewanella sp. TC10 TaxID=1419739 RepID=UPI00129E492D|nr:molecular chaperone TorD family protein [Shewanella sp. TC10]